MDIKLDLKKQWMDKGKEVTSETLMDFYKGLQDF
jgi:hypothetical protein